MKREGKLFWVLDRLGLILFQLLLFLLPIIILALSLASSVSFYKSQWRKLEFYSYRDEYGVEVRRTIYFIGGNEDDIAHLSDGQIDSIAEHTVNYFFGDGETFALKMDDVMLNWEKTDGVSLFGERAVSHMADVKVLFGTLTVLAWVGGGLLLTVTGYLIWRRRSVKPLALRYFFGFYAFLLGAAALFCLVTLLTKESDVRFAYALWMNLHYFFFLFSPDKVAGSVILDATTELLRLEFFVNCVTIILTALLFVQLLQAALLLVLRQSDRKRTNL